MRRRQSGFTLIEVLVALVVMATMAIMAWRGLDALMKSRELAQTHIDQSARLQTVIAQWEQDLRSVQDPGRADALAFDGASLRLIRQHAQGLQVVSWSVRSGTLYRWESKPAQTAAALDDSVQRASQLLPQDSGQLRALEGISGWQLYCYRGNSWSNCLSTGNVQSAAPPASAASGVPLPPGNTQRQALPSGVRMVMQFAPSSGFNGALTRQIELVTTP
ncbi:prepilin-type N-terminal cleavage/methylation domain-containing protein [Paucibacter sp. AS339]|uniref:PulJ/GspJ family protein n=1 Tax=Paucibacter hankyongi TaxID=3133434 RepID=UPI00309F2CC2